MRLEPSDLAAFRIATCVVYLEWLFTVPDATVHQEKMRWVPRTLALMCGAVSESTSKHRAQRCSLMLGSALEIMAQVAGDIELSPARLEQWRAACAWLETQRFQRVREVSDVPEAFRALFDPENQDELRALGLVGRAGHYWLLRPDFEVKLAYFGGDPETVAGMKGVRDRLTALADRFLGRIGTLDGILALERGARSKWETDWALVARGQREAMNRVSVFALRGYVSEIVRAVRELRREARIGG